MLKVKLESERRVRPCLEGLTPAAVLDIDESIVSELGIGPAMLPRSRANGFRNMLETAGPPAHSH